MLIRLSSSPLHIRRVGLVGFFALALGEKIALEDGDLEVEVKNQTQ